MAVSEQAFRVLQQRLTAVEGRLSEIDNAFGETLYRLERRTIRQELATDTLLHHLGLPQPTEEQVDPRIEEQA